MQNVWEEMWRGITASDTKLKIKLPEEFWNPGLSKLKIHSFTKTTPISKCRKGGYMNARY